MAFQSLISGSECGPSNPLSQILKHAEGDRSLQHDRVGGPSLPSLHHLPGTSRQAANEADQAAARRFFEATQDHANHSPSPVFHAFNQIRPHENAHGPEFEKWQQEQRIRLATRAPLESGWTSQFHNQIPPIVSQGQESSSQTPSLDSSYSNISFMSRPFYPTFSPIAQGPSQWASPFHMYDTSQTKGKGKATEADFEAAFAAAEKESSATITEVGEKVEELPPGQKAPAGEDAYNARMSAQLVADEKVADLSNTLEQSSLDDTDDTSLNTGFQRVWDQLRNSELPPDQRDLAKWEAEYNALMSAQRDELYDGESLEEMEKAWAESGIEKDPGFGLDRFKLDEDGRPSLGAYEFDRNNPHLAEKSGNSHLAAAKTLMESNGSLTEAALLLEAAIQQGDFGEGGYEAWILLGEVKAMDEMEMQGLKALTQGVKIAELGGAHGTGMLSLAVAYTNENYDRASQMTLMSWLRARFPDHTATLPPLPSSTNMMPWALHDAVTDAFLTVARTHYQTGQPPDADLQVGLGVLYYTNGEYAKAADCFASALSVRPNDYLLWNRYGSCLSNGSKPEDALGAYRQALALRPTYTRAIYNVGVACLNIGALKEAVEHLLSALSLQGTHNPSNSPSGEMKSEQTWSTLRRTLVAMDRADLVEKSKTGDLEVFRREGFDF